MTTVNAGLLKRVYIVSVFLCCVFHFAVFILHWHFGFLVLNARTWFENLAVMFCSLATLYMAMSIKNHVVEVPQKSEKVSAPLRKNAILFLYVFAMICLSLTYFLVFLETRQVFERNASVSTILVVFVLILAMHHSPLSEDG